MDKHIEIIKSDRMVTKVVVDDKNTTKVTVALKDNFGELLSSTGYAKLNPGDFYDYETGKGIALGRAFVKFGKRLEHHFEHLSETYADRKARIKGERRLFEIVESVDRMNLKMRQLSDKGAGRINQQEHLAERPEVGSRQGLY